MGSDTVLALEGICWGINFSWGNIQGNVWQNFAFECPWVYFQGWGVWGQSFSCVNVLGDCPVQEKVSGCVSISPCRMTSLNITQLRWAILVNTCTHTHTDRQTGFDCL